MGKNKLARFAEMAQFPNVIQPDYQELLKRDFFLKGNWNCRYFKNDNPVTLELGCGKGEYTIGLAQRFPNANFIGVDIKGARIWRGAHTALEEKLNNVVFIRTHIELINRIFGSDEISEIWLTFPDPQEKHRRRKKRLTSPRFLSLYRQFLKKEGNINLKTDNKSLFQYTHALINENHFPLHSASEDLYGSSFADLTYDIRTYYEQMFLKQGQNIFYLRFSIPGHEEIREPKEE